MYVKKIKMKIMKMQKACKQLNSVEKLTFDPKIMLQIKTWI